MPDYMGAVPLVTLDMVQQSIMRARFENDHGRKLQATKRLDYYKGEQEEHLERVLAKQFKHPERLRLQLSFSNIIKRIINEVSVVYKKAPERRLSAADGTRMESPEIDSFMEMYEESNANSVLKKVNRYTNLLNTVGLQVVWRNERVELEILTPDILNIIQDPLDTTKAAAVIIEQCFTNTLVAESDHNPFGANKLHIVWTPAQHMVFDEKGRTRQDLANQSGVNPYGIIPIVFFRDQVPDAYFWNEGSDDLINAQETLNVQLTQLNQLIKMQAFSIPVIIGDAPPEGVTIDPSNFISIPLGDGVTGKGQPDFKFVTPSPKIMDLIEAIKETVRRIADDWGLSMDSFKLSGSPASGLSLKLSNIRLIERRQDDVELYLNYEKELFKIMRIVHNAHCLPADKIAEDAEFGINFAELEFPEDPAKEDARWITLIGQNVKNRAQWLMAVDPDIADEQEAEEILLHNAELNSRTKTIQLPSLPGGALVDNLTGDAQSANGSTSRVLARPGESQAANGNMAPGMGNAQ